MYGVPVRLRNRGSCPEPNRGLRLASWLAIAAALVAGCDVVIPVVDRLAGGPLDSAAAPFDSGIAAPDSAAPPLDSGIAKVVDAGLDVGSGPFGSPSLVAAVSDPQSDNEDPSLSADGLTLYFMSTRSGNNDIWVSQRSSTSSAWGAPQRVNELSTAAGEAEPFIAPDGMTLWFTTNRDTDAGPGYHIWVAKRSTPAGPWSAPEPVSELGSPGTDGKPSVDETELVMAFMSDREGGAGGMDVYLSSRATPVDLWGSPVNVAEVNTAGDERDPFIGAQDLQLFWAADGPNEEIQSAMRPSVAQQFSPSPALIELGTPDFDDTFSPDLRHVMFARGPAGAQEIYEAFR